MKKCFKNIVSVFIAALIAASSVIAAGAAGSYFLSEGYYYGIKNKEAFVHGYAGGDWDIVIREKYLNYYVTAVDEFAFYENETVKALSFYDATQLRSIGRYAFSDCTSLEYVDITSTVQEMGDSVFEGCTSLKAAHYIDGSLTCVPAQTFYGCTALSAVIFDNGVTSIGDFAFAGCTSLDSITLPDTVISISDSAFNGCDGLTVRCYGGSYAMQYAVDHGMDYELIGDAGDEVTFILGDADGNGDVTILDATQIQRVLAELTVGDPDGVRLRGDCDGEGLNILDATKIQRWLAELGAAEPIGQPKTVRV